MNTYSAKPNSVPQKWYVVDAAGQTLGRLATQIAMKLRGKDKPEYTPHVDTGDFVVVLNASKIEVTGNKAKDKMYYRHSQYPGGLKETNFNKLRETHPERIINFAVKGMMPKGPLGRKMLKKLKVYSNETHPHEAQQPQVLEVNK